MLEEELPGSTEVQKYRSTEVQKYRSTEVQKYRSTEALEVKKRRKGRYGPPKA